MRHLDGLSIQSFINWVKTFFRVSRKWNIAPTWSLARPFTYLSPFISQILDLLYWMVSISIFDGIKVKKENLCTVWNESIKTVNTRYRLPQHFYGSIVHLCMSKSDAIISYRDRSFNKKHNYASHLNDCTINYMNPLNYEKAQLKSCPITWVFKLHNNISSL